MHAEDDDDQTIYAAAHPNLPAVKAALFQLARIKQHMLKVEKGTPAPSHVPTDTPTSIPTVPQNHMCENTCNAHNDGECDDGGQGSDFSKCELGTDCTDCGFRLVPFTPAPTNSPAPSFSPTQAPTLIPTPAPTSVPTYPPNFVKVSLYARLAGTSMYQRFDSKKEALLYIMESEESKSGFDAVEEQTFLNAIHTHKTFHGWAFRAKQEMND
jgi:hypothetical protein